MSANDLRLSPWKNNRAAMKPGATEEQPNSDDDVRPVVPAARGGGRSTLFDSFELNAVVVRQNRLVNGTAGDGGGGVSGWFMPKVLLRRLKCAFLGRQPH